MADARPKRKRKRRLKRECKPECNRKQGACSRSAPQGNPGRRKRRRRLVTCGSGSYAVGRMTDSSQFVAMSYDGIAAARDRLARDGYLLLRGFLDRSEVLECRRNVLKLAGIPESAVRSPHAQHNPMRVEIGHPLRLLQRQDVANSVEALKLLEHPRITRFFRALFECAEVSTTRYKWLRSVGRNEYTGVHVDAAYMGGGSSRLTTMWLPLGDVPVRQGTLLVSTGSNHAVAALRRSAEEAKSRNEALYRAERYVISRAGTDGTTSGWVATEPGQVPEALLGDEWVTADMNAGDVVIIGLDTVHMSTANTTRHWRLSVDTRWQPASESKDPALKFYVP